MGYGTVNALITAVLTTTLTLFLNPRIHKHKAFTSKHLSRRWGSRGLAHTNTNGHLELNCEVLRVFCSASLWFTFAPDCSQIP